MSIIESNLYLDAFNRLCDELDASKLLSKEECQYWIFERGYLASLEERLPILQLPQTRKVKFR